MRRCCDILVRVLSKVDIHNQHAVWVAIHRADLAIVTAVRQISPPFPYMSSPGRMRRNATS